MLQLVVDRLVWVSLPSYSPSALGHRPAPKGHITMDSLFIATAPTADILTEKYRPHHIADFIGLDKPRRIASKIAANPPSKGGLLFLGEPGSILLMSRSAFQRLVRKRHTPSSATVWPPSMPIGKLTYTPTRKMSKASANVPHLNYSRKSKRATHPLGIAQHRKE